MTEPNQIRINELARELEVKAKAIIDYLPAAGVTEKKTHSSSIDVDAAERVRKHFRDAADEEAAAEQKAVAEKAAKEAAAKAVRLKPAVAAPPPAPSVAAAPRAPAVLEPVPPVAPPPPVSVVPKPAAPTVIAAKPVSAVPPVPVKPAPVHPAATARPAARPAVTAPAPPKPIAPQVPAAAKPAPAPLAASARPATSPAASARHGATTHPTSSAKSAPKPNWNPLPPGARVNPPPPVRPTASARPGASQSRFPSRPGVPGRPGQQVPVRPGQPMPGRPGGPRPGGRPAPVLPSDKMPPKAEPGKPIYERKPAARARPTIEKRFEEGERKLHPVRARVGPGERRTAHIERAPAPPPREPREITITEGVTVRDLAEKLDVRAKEVLKILLDRGIFASINQALDTATATNLAESFNGIVKVLTF
jgi:translation initiation factor IF-2